MSELDVRDLCIHCLLACIAKHIAKHIIKTNELYSHTFDSELGALYLCIHVSLLPKP